MDARYNVQSLKSAVASIFAAAGLDQDKAEVTSKVLIEADLIGHTTHGLALAPWYLDAIASGGMTKTGEPLVISDRGACVAWDGQRLPGLWLTAKAVELAVDRAEQFGSVTVCIGNGHHIGCLAAYLGAATERGFYIMLASSSPSGASVAPFGGTKPIYTPNPLAVGIPTSGDPILIDVSASITTQNMTSRLAAEKKQFDYPWLMEADGNLTTDPEALGRGGSLLPTGGLDHGQKGYGLALMVESLTQGLSGIGRADNLSGTNASVFLQVFDPAAFGGAPGFFRQVDWLVEACRSNPPRSGVERVRLPGDRAQARKRAALQDGLVLHGGIVSKLAPWAERYGVSLEDAVST